MTSVFIVANEAAVEVFRKEAIHFLDIPTRNKAIMHALKEALLKNTTLVDIVEGDEEDGEGAVEPGKLASEFKAVAA